jgi:hypothetical protein
VRLFCSNCPAPSQEKFVKFFTWRGRGGAGDAHLRFTIYDLRVAGFAVRLGGSGRRGSGGRQNWMCVGMMNQTNGAPASGTAQRRHFPRAVPGGRRSGSRKVSTSKIGCTLGTMNHSIGAPGTAPASWRTVAPNEPRRCSALRFTES